MTPFLPVLVYVSAALFLAGMNWRLAMWLRTPVPLKVVLTPGPTTTAGVTQRLAGEVFLFRSLFQADRWLWVTSWLFFLFLGVLGGGGYFVRGGFARTAHT